MSDLYTYEELETVDQALKVSLSSRIVQPALKALSPRNFPKPSQYRPVLKEMLLDLQSYQPKAFRGMPNHAEGLRVIEYCPIRPVALISLWTQAAILAFLLKDYESGAKFTTFAFETSGQWGDDHILLAGAKLAFAAASPLIWFPEAAYPIFTNARYCHNIVVDHKSEIYRRHSLTPQPCGYAFAILELLVVYNPSQGEKDALTKDDLKEAIAEPALYLDRWTKFQFKFRDWVNAAIIDL